MSLAREVDVELARYCRRIDRVALAYTDEVVHEALRLARRKEDPMTPREAARLAVSEALAAEARLAHLEPKKAKKR